MKRAKPFATEADLCAAFIAAVPKGWTAYPETGWDILLVRKVDGYQIGIEAKLKLNAVVVAQAIKGLDRPYSQDIGPDYRAVLVPEGEGVTGIRDLARHCGVTVVEYRQPQRGVYTAPIHPALPEPRDAWLNHDWFELVPHRRHELPAFVPDVAAGKPAPVQLTDWKIRALKLAVIMDIRGPATRADFKELGLDSRRWTERWLLRGADGFRPSAAMPPFKKQHPKVYAELVATAEKWMPPYVPPAPIQEGML